MPATAVENLQIAPGDQLQPVAKVAEKRSGTRPHPTSVCRWCRRGASGVVLPSLIVAGQRMTTEAAFDAWLVAVTEARNAV